MDKIAQLMPWEKDLLTSTTGLIQTPNQFGNSMSEGRNTRPHKSHSTVAQETTRPEYSILLRCQILRPDSSSSSNYREDWLLNTSVRQPA